MAPVEERMTLRFDDDGLVSRWEERRGSAWTYDQYASGPFIRWLTRTYPDIESPAPLDIWWRTDTGFADIAAELADEWTQVAAGPLTEEECQAYFFVSCEAWESLLGR